MEERRHLPKSAILNCYMLFACIKDIKGLVRESSSPADLSKLYIFMWTKMAFDCLLLGFTYSLLFLVMKNMQLKLMLWKNIYAKKKE